MQKAFIVWVNDHRRRVIGRRLLNRPLARCFNTWKLCISAVRFHAGRARTAPSVDCDEAERFPLSSKGLLRSVPNPAGAPEDQVPMKALTEAGSLLNRGMQNMPTAQALVSMAWVRIFQGDLEHLHPLLQATEHRLKTGEAQLLPLLQVGLSVGGRLRVLWRVKVEGNTEKMPCLKNDAEKDEVWQDVWWGCTVISAVVGQTDLEGRPMWQLLYDALPSSLNSFRSELRHASFLSASALLDDAAGVLVWKSEDNSSTNLNEMDGLKGVRPSVWPPSPEWVLAVVETIVFSQSYDFEPSWWQDALQALAKVANAPSPCIHSWKATESLTWSR